ncbi:sugar transferase [Synoicihabitans lomoniglobus]|uniref:Sugar transferase n=1 Tax=Synoicihabitans lomoniglobus TaxID=2909285 RepID=A0AAF0CQV3_9BACT|nr:sugar transferase [Opitutaceae bacterium LMO-M01]WED66377.1 sugar transferase [Opitutaceae bacterium LMO-M01]
MLTHSRRTRSSLGQIADAGLFMLALASAYTLRAYFPWGNLPALEGIEDYLWLFPWVGGLGAIMLRQQGLYAQPRLTSRLGIMLIIVRACLFTVLGTILLLFLLRAQFARSVVILVGGFGGLLIYGRHELTRWSTGDPRWQRRVLWLGTAVENQRAQASLSAMEREALITVATADPGQTAASAFVELLHEQEIDAVIASLGEVDRASVAPLLEACEREGIELLVRPGLPLGSAWRLTVDEFGGEPVLYVRPQDVAPTALVIKQGFDYLIALIAIVVAAPLMAVIAVAIKLTSGGPILFRQPRGGRNGRTFAMLKFRSMREGAESERADLADRNQLNGPAFKLTDDPRVTPLGRILRRHSLDELPQLWNVLRGEMSLVGPRPLPVSEVAAIADGADRRRLSVKPGITGLWQISGRSDIADFADWVRLDLAYIDQWSLWLDCKILLGTIPVAIFGRGAS